MEEKLQIIGGLLAGRTALLENTAGKLKEEREQSRFITGMMAAKIEQMEEANMTKDEQIKELTAEIAVENVKSVADRKALKLAALVAVLYKKVSIIV